jgi:hypothetical protein
MSDELEIVASTHPEEPKMPFPGQKKATGDR